MAVRKQRAAYRKSYEMSRDYDKVLSFAKRQHRVDEVFYITNLDGFYSDVSASDFKMYSYSNYDRWEFVKNKWVKTEEVQ